MLGLIARLLGRRREPGPIADPPSTRPFPAPPLPLADADTVELEPAAVTVALEQAALEVERRIARARRRELLVHLAERAERERDAPGPEDR